MINLLPPEVKTGYRYARRNVVLRKWVVMGLLSLVGLAAITTFGLLTIKQSTDDYTSRIAAAQVKFKQEDFDGTQKKVQDISNNFKLLVQVLSKEILFSSLLQRIGAVMPDGAQLTQLSIAQVQGGINITANALDYQTASQVQVNLSDPHNNIFAKADIQSITCQNTATSGAYPCTVNIRALFNQDNPFLFIKSQGKPKP